jgi:hypothetical protein
VAALQGKLDGVAVQIAELKAVNAEQDASSGGTSRTSQISAQSEGQEAQIQQLQDVGRSY